MARHLVPALTTVRVSGQEIGTKTAELILKQLQNRHVENLIVTVGSIFIERETT